MSGSTDGDGDEHADLDVHRHPDEEVCGWYRTLGYGQLQCVSKRDAPDYVPISFVACTGVDGVREPALSLEM